MKKKQIGFTNVNDCKTKASDETSNNDSHSEHETIPPHIINEIEENVMAKQEYEHSMHQLYIFKRSFKTILIILAIIFAVGIFYGGYKYGCYTTEMEYKKTCELMEKFEFIYNLGRTDAFNKARLIRKQFVAPNKAVKVEIK